MERGCTIVYRNSFRHSAFLNMLARLLGKRPSFRESGVKELTPGIPVLDCTWHHG